MSKVSWNHPAHTAPADEKAQLAWQEAAARHTQHRYSGDRGWRRSKPQNGSKKIRATQYTLPPKASGSSHPAHAAPARSHNNRKHGLSSHPLRAGLAGPRARRPRIGAAAAAAVHRGPGGGGGVCRGRGLRDQPPRQDTLRIPGGAAAARGVQRRLSGPARGG